MDVSQFYVDQNAEFDYSIVDTVIERIVSQFKPLKIYIFGSVSRHEAHNGSDIDMLVVIDTDKPINEQASEIYMSMFDVGVPTDILVTTPDRLQEQSSNPYSLISEIVTNGVVASEC